MPFEARKSPIRGIRSSLMVRLMGAFVLVIFIGALVIYFLTSQATQNAFRLYTTQSSQIQAQRLAPLFADYYAQIGGWQDVSAWMQSGVTSISMPGMMPGGNGRGHGMGMGNAGLNGSGMAGIDQRMILADSNGQILVDTEYELAGTRLSEEELASGSPVTVNNQVVGVLIVAPADLKAVPNPASTFLASVNRSIMISVLVAGGLSLLLVFLFTVQITAPIRQIKKAAGSIAAGDLDQRVAVHSNDELGDLAESFNHMAGSLAAAETQRRKLLADVAHELRTPLAVIQAHAEGMQDGVLPVEIDEVNAIHAETLLLGRLIEDLRVVSLSEGGQLRLEQRSTDLENLLRQAVERILPQCQQKGVTLAVDIPSPLPVILTDSDRILQVVNNLVSNSLRYTPAGGKITIRAAANASGVHVSVTDNGSGIAAEDLPLIFDRFYRVDKSRTRASGGSGLGLAIVKHLVEAHGGTVQARSPVFADDPDHFGTQITFTLPVR